MSESAFGFNKDCDFKAKMRVNKTGQVLKGQYSCVMAHSPSLSAAEYTLLHKALHGETIHTVITKRCLCGPIRFAIDIFPTRGGGAKINIEALEKVAQSHILEFRPQSRQAAQKADLEPENIWFPEDWNEEE